LANTKQGSALAAATNLFTLMQTFQTMRRDAKAYVDSYNSEGFNLIWNQLPTYTINADGTVPTSSGVVVTDGSPNVAHPTVANNKSATQMIAGVTVLNQFINFCQNGAVTTAQYSQTIDDLSV
jgi:hypothetical protein